MKKCSVCLRDYINGDDSKQICDSCLSFEKYLNEKQGFLNVDKNPILIEEKIHSNESDPVNNPKHYNSHPSGIECATIARHHSFNIGNVIKYIWRAGIKDSSTWVEDLKKARWYLEDEIKKIEREKANEQR